MDARPAAFTKALHRVQGMPFAWSLNPYRGCRHACLYCYARVYHSYLGFDDPGDFDRVILQKEDLAAALDREIRSRRRPLEGEVAIGTATDPYQPLEARERITRRVLEVMLHHGLPVSITTKSPLVARDLDLLRAFASFGGVRVHMTVTVLDQNLWRLLEPMTALPKARIETAKRLRDAGIPVSVFLAPVVPFVGEDEAAAVLRLSAAAGVDHVMMDLLRLSPGVGEWLLPRLRASLPAAARRLASLYGSSKMPPDSVRRDIMAPLVALQRELGVGGALLPLNPRQRQLTLFAPLGPPDPAAGDVNQRG